MYSSFANYSYVQNWYFGVDCVWFDTIWSFALQFETALCSFFKLLEKKNNSTQNDAFGCT